MIENAVLTGVLQIRVRSMFHYCNHKYQQEKEKSRWICS